MQWFLRWLTQQDPLFLLSFILPPISLEHYCKLQQNEGMEKHMIRWWFFPCFIAQVESGNRGRIRIRREGRGISWREGGGTYITTFDNQFRASLSLSFSPSLSIFNLHHRQWWISNERRNHYNYPPDSRSTRCMYNPCSSYSLLFFRSSIAEKKAPKKTISLMLLHTFLIPFLTLSPTSSFHYSFPCSVLYFPTSYFSDSFLYFKGRLWAKSYISFHSYTTFTFPSRNHHHPPSSPLPSSTSSTFGSLSSSVDYFHQ